MKKYFVILLSILMIACSTLVCVSSSNVASGTCGENVNWTLDSDGVLSISGSGKMFDYNHPYESSYESPTSDGEISEYAPFHWIPEHVPWVDRLDDITSVVIQQGVTGIGEKAFEYCPNLSDVSIPESVTRIGSCAFAGSGVNTGFDISLPDGIIEFGSNVFEGSGVRKVNIPSAFTDVYDMHGEDAAPYLYLYFLGEGLALLEAIDVAPNNPNYASLDGVLFNKDMTELLLYPQARTAAKYTIPESVSTVAEYAFHAVPVSTTEFMTTFDAFQQRFSNGEITEKEYGFGLMSVWSQNAAFYLQEINIPATVKTVSDLAFICGGGSILSWYPHTLIVNFEESEENCPYTLPDSSLLDYWDDYFESTADLLGIRLNYGVDFSSVPTDYLVTDNETGIGFTYTSDAFDGDASFRIVAVEAGTEYDAAATLSDGKRFVLFDITAYMNNENVQPREAVTVKIPVPEGWNRDNIDVYYITNTGAKQKLDSYIDGEYICFACEHFSCYAVVDNSSVTGPANEGENETPKDLCDYCGKPHKGFFGGIVAFVHRILYFFKQLFK